MATSYPDMVEAPAYDRPEVDRPARPRFDWRYLLYFYLHGLAFVGITLLLTWGTIVLFFLAIGGFSIDGMMAHLNNLALRYVAADFHRQMAFKDMMSVVQMIIACLFMFFRRHAFLPFRDLDRSTPNG